VQRLRAVGLLLALATFALSGCGSRCAGSPDLRVVLDGQPAVLAKVRTLSIGVTFGGGARQSFLLDLEGVLEPGRALLLSPTMPIGGQRYELTVEITGLAADKTPLASGRVVADVATDACNEVAMTLGAAAADMQ
jgi:hypothetical protein